MREFSRKQKQAVQLVTGREGEADHIKPYSKGGKTEVENCQILSPAMNKKKGAFDFKPREWQTAFLNDWKKRVPKEPFMLIAIPGGGKTMAALEAARTWMAAASDRRVIIVVPTDNLREQWKDEAANFGMDLQTKELGTNFKHGFCGAVTTYSFVSTNRAMFRALCTVPTMVIFDEIHHCGERASFGDGIKDAFGLAEERLLMSGTPWKSDGRPIPFVKYDGNGYAVGDFTYDYPLALVDGVVRYLVFDHSIGIIRNECTGDIEVLSKDISEDEASYRLRNLLKPDGDYVREQIADAHRKLVECRKTIPDAAALAACIDMQHAVKVASVIRKVTGCEPSLIVSDNELVNDTVRKFRTSGKEWLVSVRMVSEGTDIRRLQVLCYLTNTTSELFFRQIIGRVSRVRDLDDFEAYVYLPADPRLIRCRENIENAQVQALQDISDRESRELREREQSDSGFVSYSTHHGGTELVAIGNEQVPLAEAKKVEAIAESTGVSMQKVLQIMSMCGDISIQRTEKRIVEIPKEDRMMELRKRCDSMAYVVAMRKKVHVKEINRRFKPVAQMTEEELQSKLDQLIRESEEARQ